LKKPGLAGEVKSTSRETGKRTEREVGRGGEKTPRDKSHGKTLQKKVLWGGRNKVVKKRGGG